MIVLRHPPPNFFAPQPAASPRNNLLIVGARLQNSHLCSGVVAAAGVVETPCNADTPSETSPALPPTVVPLPGDNPAKAQRCGVADDQAGKTGMVGQGGADGRGGQWWSAVILQRLSVLSLRH